MSTEKPRFLNWHKPLLAEFIGTFGLTFIGAGAICSEIVYHNVGLVGIALVKTRPECMHSVCIQKMGQDFYHPPGGRPGGDCVQEATEQ